MLFLLQQYQEVILTSLKMTTRTFSRVPFFRVYININVRIGWIDIGIFYPLGKPISLHLLRCDPFAVHLYSSMDRRLASAASLARE